MFDDELPLKKQVPAKNLEPLSISELNAYIEELKAEIERVQGDIKKKEAHKSAAADSFFKK